MSVTNSATMAIQSTRFRNPDTSLLDMVSKKVRDVSKIATANYEGETAQEFTLKQTTTGTAMKSTQGEQPQHHQNLTVRVAQCARSLPSLKPALLPATRIHIVVVILAVHAKRNSVFRSRFFHSSSRHRRSTCCRASARSAEYQIYRCSVCRDCPTRCQCDPAHRTWPGHCRQSRTNIDGRQGSPKCLVRSSYLYRQVHQVLSALIRLEA